MNKKEIAEIRSQLGKTQKQMSQLLGTSLKSVQSFEQGWRNVPVHIERQALFLLAMKRCRGKKKPLDCWTIRKCPPELRDRCPAWEFQGGCHCWLINGTICGGEVQKTWQKKMALCRKCEVFRGMFATD